MSQLIDHIKKLNEETQIWINEDPDNRWASLLIEDIDHWKSYSVETVEDFERYQLETFIKSHNKVYNSKDYSKLSLDELRKKADELEKIVKETIDEEQEAERRAESQFEAHINETIELGANTRENAIRWILEANGLLDEHDAEFICFQLNLPYKMAEIFKPYVKKGDEYDI